MKKGIYLRGLLVGMMLLLLPVTAQAKSTKKEGMIPVTAESFSDKRILKKAKSFDKDKDGYLSPEEIAAVKILRCSMDVIDLSQLKYFTNLRQLSIDGKNMSRYDGETLNFTVFPKLEHLSLLLDYKKPSSAVPDIKVKVSGLKQLKSFQIVNWYVGMRGKKPRYQFVDTIDLRGLPLLTTIHMNSVKGLVFDEDSEIEEIEVHHMAQVPYGQLGKLRQLERLVVWADDPDFTEIDLSENCFLTTLNVHNSCLKKVKLAGAEALESLSITSKSLEELDLTHSKKLKRLRLSCAKLKTLDTTQNSKLYQLYVSSKKIDTLDFTKNPSLKRVELRTEKLGTLSVSEHKKLEDLRVTSGALTALNLENNEKLKTLDIIAGKLTELDLTAIRALWHVTIQNTGLKSLDLSGQTNMFAFETRNNKNLTQIRLPEEAAIEYLTVVDTPWQSFNLSQWETLKELELGGDVKADGLDDLPSGLSSLAITDFPWKSIDLSGLENLQSLTLKGDIKVTVLKDLPACIEYLTVEDTPVKAVDLSKLDRLTSVNFHKNKKLVSLDVTKNQSMYQMDVSDSVLGALKLGALPNLRFLDCENNKLTALDLSGVPKDCEVYCDKNVKVKGFKGSVHTK